MVAANTKDDGRDDLETTQRRPRDDPETSPDVLEKHVSISYQNRPADPVVRIPRPESAVDGAADQNSLAELQKTYQRRVAIEAEQAVSRDDGPYLDRIVHLPRHASAAHVFENHTEDLLQMSRETRHHDTRRDLPYPDGAVDRATDDSIAVNCHSGYRFVVTSEDAQRVEVSVMVIRRTDLTGPTTIRMGKLPDSHGRVS
ncbi:cell division control protein 4, partial [Aureobasidium melanogenum]